MRVTTCRKEALRNCAWSALRTGTFKEYCPISSRRILSMSRRPCRKSHIDARSWWDMVMRHGRRRDSSASSLTHGLLARGDSRPISCIPIRRRRRRRLYRTHVTLTLLSSLQDSSKKNPPEVTLLLPSTFAERIDHHCICHAGLLTNHNSVKTRFLLKRKSTRISVVAYIDH